MTRRLYLLRHAMPEVSAGLPPEEWPLSSAGETAARTLVGRVPGAALVLASTEVKAVQTARLACGVEPQVDPVFGEVRRPGEPFGGDVRERRAAWVGGVLDARHAGWETPAEATARFAAGLAAYEGDLVVATHGMVLTAWLVGTGHVAPGDAAVRFWQGLAFPDVVEVEA